MIRLRPAEATTRALQRNVRSEQRGSGLGGHAEVLPDRGDQVANALFRYRQVLLKHTRQFLWHHDVVQVPRSRWIVQPSQ